jgi:methionyl-tRNA formyltransferase
MSLQIVFMGTPDFAVPSLDILVQHGYEIVGVITATDKLGGRGKNKLIQSAVKKYALEKGIRVLQPKNLKAPEFVEELRSLKADLQVVVAFRMLPVVVWDMPPMGTINLHGSLLPKYRGAAPINWAVINGETETGVTTFFLKHEIDTGDLLFQEKMPIGPDETAGEVHDRMMRLGAEVVLRSVRAIESGNYELKPQSDEEATKAPKIHLDTCRINFQQPVKKVHDFVRGLSPYPAAWCELDGQNLKILRSRMDPAQPVEKPGALLSDNKREIKIACEDGYLEVLELQLQGRKRMGVKDFLNGYSFEGDIVLK